jgi:hypothetical protein
MNEFAEPNGTLAESAVSFLGFALSDCVVEVDQQSVKYLRAVHRTALELAEPNCFGVDVGGFWLTEAQIVELRKLPEYYSPNEAPLVVQAVNAYLRGQLMELYPMIDSAPSA